MQKDKQLANSNEINENHEMGHEEDLTRFGMLDFIRKEREAEIEE